MACCHWPALLSPNPGLEGRDDRFPKWSGMTWLNNTWKNALALFTSDCGLKGVAHRARKFWYFSSRMPPAWHTHTNNKSSEYSIQRIGPKNWDGWLHAKHGWLWPTQTKIYVWHLESWLREDHRYPGMTLTLITTSTCHHPRPQFCPEMIQKWCTSLVN